jgi:hypothetical protein
MTRTNNGGFEVRGSGKSWTFGNAQPRPGDIPYTATTGGTSRVPYGDLEIFTDGSLPSARSRGNLPIPSGGGRSVAVDVMAKVPKASAAAAVGRFAAKLSFPVTVGMAVYDLAKDLGFTASNNDGLPGIELTKIDPNAGWCNVSPCYEYKVNKATGDGYTPWRKSISQVVADAQAGTKPSHWVSFTTSYDPTVSTEFYSYGRVKYAIVGNGWTDTAYAIIERQSRTPDSGTAPQVNATIQDLENAIAAQSGWPTNASRAMVDAMDAGESVSHDAPTVTGPASVAGPTSTEQKPLPDGTGTQNVTNSTTYNVTYAGDTVTINETTTTTTTTTYNNGTPTKTESATKTEETQPETTPARDTSLPEQPKLYEPKYPQGPSGVWDSQVALIKATPLFALPAQLAPNLGDSGGCPNWSIPLDVGIHNWGTQTTTIPCWVWSFLRVCTIVGALFLARRLIFGG